MNREPVEIVVADAVEYISEEMIKKGYAVGSDDKIAFHDIILMLSDYAELMRDK
jgi:hypothetical protein